MRSFLKLTWMEMKLFLREPQAAFFTLVFPLILLFVYGAVYGNAPSPMFGGRGSVDVSVPSYTAMIIAVSSLISLPIILSTYRETGILRRLKTTPLRPLALLAADVIVVFTMTAFGMALLIAAARIFFGLKFAGDAVGFGLAFVLSCLSIFSLGFILAAVVKTARTAQITGMAFFFPMIFLSGATIPIEIMPARVQALSRFIPLTYVVRMLKGLWFGQEWSRFAGEAALLLALMAVALAVTVKIFRWE